MTTLDTLQDLEAPTGYATEDTYFATRMEQGGREMFSIDLSIPQLVATVPRPDPLHPIEGNRRIDPGRAKAFAEYVRARNNWVCPSILLRAPSGEFHFKGALVTDGGTQFGELSVPRLSRSLLHILDGQHRILGFHLLWEQVTADIEKQRITVARSRKEEDKELTAAYSKRLKALQQERDDIATQRVQVTVLVLDDPRDYKQVFYDIADNAKGISGSVRVRFDTTKVANRALETVLAHPLLENRVEMESDRISGPYLLAAKSVTDIVRAVQVGVNGRISRRQEEEFSDAKVQTDALNFFSVLCDAYPEFQSIRDGSLAPAALRAGSLLGSSTFLRVLAGVWRALAERGMDPIEVIEYFRSLDPLLRVPITQDSHLLLTGCFQPGANAPSARQGDVIKLEATLVQWAIDPPDFLNQP